MTNDNTYKLWLLQQLLNGNGLPDIDPDREEELNGWQNLGQGPTETTEIQNKLDERLSFRSNIVFTITTGKRPIAVELTHHGYRVHTIH